MLALSLTFSITIFLQVSDVIDVAKVKKYENLEVNKPEEKTLDASERIAGITIAFLNTNGSSRQECLQKAKDIITDVVKKQENFLWFSDEYLLP